MITLEIADLSAEAFAPFGDVVEAVGAPGFQINNGMCDRYHDLARLDFAGGDGHTALSLGVARPYELPLEVKMVERHPLGSQAFIPLDARPFLVIVAQDRHGRPGSPKVFRTNGRQGVNYHRGTWHGVLTPIAGEQTFLIVDRKGPEQNLEEYTYDETYLIPASG